MNNHLRVEATICGEVGILRAGKFALLCTAGCVRGVGRRHAYLNRNEAENLSSVVIDHGQVADVGGNHFLHASLDRVGSFRSDHLRAVCANLLDLHPERQRHIYASVRTTDVWCNFRSVGGA